MNIYLKDYLHLSRQNDATPAVVEALCNCRDGDTLYLGGGELHFYPEFAHRAPYYVSNNDYSNKAILFLLKNRRRFSVNGEGASLVFHGPMTPFVIDGCTDITVEKLFIDYHTPHFSQAKITAATDTYTDITFDQKDFFCRIKDGKFCFYSPDDGREVCQDSVLMTEFDSETGAPSAYIAPYFDMLTPPEEGHFQSDMFRYVKAEQIKEDTIRLSGDVGCVHTVGNYWLCTFGGRHNPGIFINEARNTVLRDVTLYHTMAMGVIAQLSENVTLERVACKTRPGSGRLLSVSADATHFVNCEGLIRLQDCTFVSMLDDALNIHGIYMRVEQVLSRRTFTAKFGHGQQRGIPLFRPGDEIRFVKNETMAPYATLTVEDARLISGDYARITVREALPEDLAPGHAVENITRMPAAHLSGCTSGNNRPRGFLLTTNRPVLVEDCTFYNMNAAIECAGDANGWYESGPVTSLTVRGCHFENAAYAGGPVIDIAPRVSAPDAPPFHQSITVEGCHFRLHEKRFLIASHAANIRFIDNTYEEDASLPAHKQVCDEGFYLNHCRDCSLEPLRVITKYGKM